MLRTSAPLIGALERRNLHRRYRQASNSDPLSSPSTIRNTGHVRPHKDTAMQLKLTTASIIRISALVSIALVSSDLLADPICGERNFNDQSIDMHHVNFFADTATASCNHTPMFREEGDGAVVETANNGTTTQELNCTLGLPDGTAKILIDLDSISWQLLGDTNSKADPLIKVEIKRLNGGAIYSESVTHTPTSAHYGSITPGLQVAEKSDAGARQSGVTVRVFVRDAWAQGTRTAATVDRLCVGYVPET